MLLQIGDFTSFISTETGFGTVTLKQGKPSINAKYGTIPVRRVLVAGKETEFGKA
jgi:hypothetical protein